MISILMPVPVENIELAEDAISRIQTFTDIPFSLIVVVDGGTRGDLSGLEAHLSGSNLNWKLLHNRPRAGLNKTIIDGLEECLEKITAIIAPEVRLDDAKWVGKSQQIFHRDPTCGVVDTLPNTKSATLHPVKRHHSRPPEIGCRLALVQTSFARKVLPLGDYDPIEFWAKAVMGNGGSAWHAGGIRYFEAEHKEHQLWLSPLVRQEG